jgi:hypothetical protein
MLIFRIRRCLAAVAFGLVGLVNPSFAGGHGHAAGGDVAVKGYIKSDGTYVAPHMRSAPDGNFSNNWTTQGIVNPYTGKEGTRVTPPADYATPGYAPTPQPGAVLLNPGSGYPLQPNTVPVLTDPAADLAGQGRLRSTLTPSAPVSNAAPLQRLEAPRPRVQSYLEQAHSQNVARADYWKAKGYSFDPNYMTAFTMDQKVQDIDRAAYWKQRGHDFDPQYMTAFTMDQKVHDIDRAGFWKAKGYQFDPNYTTAFTMDQKVHDIDRAKYWNDRGYSFDPNYMTGFTMDQKVNDIERAKYWAKQGLSFDPQYMTAFTMDREAQQRLGARH